MIIMLDAEEYKGFWFLPQQEKVSFNGTLSFGPDQPIRLSLTGAPGQEIITAFPERNDFHIWGFSLKGEPVTLFDCNRITITYPLAGIQSAVYSPQYIIIGAHIEQRDSKVVKGVRVSFDHMEEWMNIYGHEVKHGANFSSYEVTFKRPDDIVFNLDKNTKGRLTFWNNFPYEHEAELVLKQQNLVKLDFEYPISIKELSQAIWKFQRFFTFMMQIKVRIRWYYIYSDEIRNPKDKLEPYPGLKELKVFYRQADYRYERDVSLYYLLPFETFKSGFERVIQNWFRVEQELISIVDILYTNIGSALNGYLHNNFLNLTHAVEAFHRKKMQNTPKLTADIKLIKDRIFSYIPDGLDKVWLEKELKYSYEPKLVKRLKQLFSLNKNILFKNVAGRSKQIDALIGKIADKRNSLTHNDGTTKVDNEDVLKIYKYSEIMKVMLIICLLRELGFNEDTITEPLQRKYAFHLAL